MTAASYYPAPIPVSGFPGATISKVVVKVNSLTHSFAKDIDMILVGPNGKKVMLMSDTGAAIAAATNATLTFDAAAAWFTTYDNENSDRYL